MIARALSVIAVACALAACAPVPKPWILGDLDKVRAGATADEARKYAPQAFDRAEKLRKDAEAAFDAGDTAGAELYGEQALAAFAEAHALARIARANADRAEAEALLQAAQKDLSALEGEQARIAADAEALELRVRVARDAQPIKPSGKADPDREKARLFAARALALEARLLCTAARMLLGKAGDAKLVERTAEAEADLAKVDAALGQGATLAPIDGATRARAACLAALTSIRRAATPASKAPGAGDALLAELSAMGSLAPSRDDRGVFVTLRDLFKGNDISPAGSAKLASLGRVAAAHPAFPVAVVLHLDKPVAPRDEAAHKARADVIAKALAKDAASVPVVAILARDAAPVADPRGPDKARNARVEIVFVTPETL